MRRVTFRSTHDGHRLGDPPTFPERAGKSALHSAMPDLKAGFMPDILNTLQDQSLRSFSAGEAVIGQGESTGALYVLIEGTVEVVKDGILVARSSEPGVIFGDLSALLGVPHTAEVHTVTACRFHVVPDARAFLAEHPPLCLHLCELLARRLDAVNKYLVDVKKQFEGHDHLGMVDQVLDTLMHRQPRPRVAPRASTLRDPEIPE